MIKADIAGRLRTGRLVNVVGKGICHAGRENKVLEVMLSE